MPRKPPGQNDWKCPKCNDANQWTWAKNQSCHICDRSKPKNVLLFGQTTAGKEVAQNKGNGGKDGSKELEKVKAELAKVKVANEKLK